MDFKKIDQKKLAKTALLSAILTLGIMLGQSIFNETQALMEEGGYKYKAEFVYENGKIVDVNCPSSGTNCR